jgi:hypothetical protein
LSTDPATVIVLLSSDWCLQKRQSQQSFTMASIAGNRNAAASGASAKVDSTTHQYTCNTCQVAFRLADTQKGHMKSDWQ